MSRRIAVWLALIIVFVALVVAAASTAENSDVAAAAPLTRDGVSYSATSVQDGNADKQVAIVPIVGALSGGDSAPDGSSTGGEDIVRMLDEIADHPDRFDGLLLELDTPGGAVTAAEEIHAAVERVQRAGIPVVAWMRDVAASAGYYVAAPADRIVAAKTTFTGSIGVILSYQQVGGLARKLGVGTVTIKSGELKDIGSPFRDATAKERGVLQSIIDEAFGGFVDVVATGRDLDEAAVRKLADGRPYSGVQAKQLGLVDELGLRRTAYDAMAKQLGLGAHDGDRLDVVRFDRSYSLFETLGADTAPTLAGLRSASAVGALLGGDVSGVASQLGAGRERARVGNGLLRLEYRAQL